MFLLNELSEAVSSALAEWLGQADKGSGIQPTASMGSLFVAEDTHILAGF